MADEPQHAEQQSAGPPCFSLVRIVGAWGFVGFLVVVLLLLPVVLPWLRLALLQRTSCGVCFWKRMPAVPGRLTMYRCLAGGDQRRVQL